MSSRWRRRCGSTKKGIVCQLPRSCSVRAKRAAHAAGSSKTDLHPRQIDSCRCVNLCFLSNVSDRAFVLLFSFFLVQSCSSISERSAPNKTSFNVFLKVNGDNHEHAVVRCQLLFYSLDWLRCFTHCNVTWFCIVPSHQQLAITTNEKCSKYIERESAL